QPPAFLGELRIEFLQPACLKRLTINIGRKPGAGGHGKISVFSGGNGENRASGVLHSLCFLLKEGLGSCDYPENYFTPPMSFFTHGVQTTSTAAATPTQRVCFRKKLASAW